MSNYVLRRPSAVYIGAYGATSTSSATDIGSIRKVTFSNSVESQKATSSKYNDAVVEVAYSGAAGELTIEFEEITAANVAYALLATSSGTTIYSDADDSTPTYYKVWVQHFPIGGVDKQLVCYRCCIRPGTEMTLANEQQVPTLTLDVMVDPDGATAQKFFAFETSATDTTAPTASATSPVDGCASIATGCAVVWSFSEAIRAEYATGDYFFLIASGGTQASASVAISCGNCVVTLTPSAAMTACGTEYQAIASKQIRDAAGNQMAAHSIINFKTA